MDIWENSIRNLNGWYWNSDIWRVNIQAMGGLCDSFQLEPGLKRLSDSGNLWNAVMNTACEYLVVAGEQICEQKNKKGTGSSRTKEDFLTWDVNYENPVLELFQSVWQESCLGTINPNPKRTLFYLDIEYYDNESMEDFLIDQESIYAYLEPLYQLTREILLDLGIDHIALVSGRGYNFISCVPAESPMFGELLNIGKCVEQTVAQMQAEPIGKRNKPVPWQTEQSFKGSMRLATLLVGMIAGEARRRWGLKVEFSDKAERGISLDLSFIVRSASASSHGLPATPYLKWHYQKHIDETVLRNTPIPVRMIRANGRHENFSDYRDFLSIRNNTENNYYQAREHFSGQTGYIPDGSAGLRNLAKLYYQSMLYQFHKNLDQYNHYWWNDDEVNEIVNRIYRYFPNISWMLDNPNPILLNPTYLDTFINELMNGGVDPIEIAVVLRAFYEEDSFNWGSIGSYNYEKRANGWVEFLGCQRYLNYSYFV